MHKQTVEKTDFGYLANTSVKTLQGPPKFSHWVLWAAALFILSAIIWASLANLDEVTTGHGKVIPSSQMQLVQNLEGGILRKILVREGEIVDEGQVLMHIDDTRFSATFNEAQKKLTALEIKMASLRSEVYNTEFILPDTIQKQYMDLYKAEKALLKSRKEELEQMLIGYQLAQKELVLTRPLVDKGAASEVEVIRLERVTNELNGKISAFKSKSLGELNAVQGDYSALKETLAAEQDRLTRTTIRAPMRGIINQIKITTVGGVIKPGEDLVEIVPLDDTLLIEAKVRPQDIGFLHTGQNAMVKITAYDFSIYGGLEGKVEQISANTITEEGEKDDKSYYLIRVRTSKNFLGSDKKPLYIIPGMQASVDILTGEKTVLAYLLKPILKARAQALRER